MPTPSDFSNPSPGKDNTCNYSSDKNGDPEALLKAAEGGVKAHSDYLLAAGLTMPVATLGSHPWLRDSLAQPGQEEPGNAEPDGKRNVPMSRNVKDSD